MKKIIFCFPVLLGGFILFFIAHLGYNFFTDNVHTVIPGEIYRSAQFNHQALKKYTKKWHLKTIINLRGDWPTNHWYRVESRFAKTHQLNYYPMYFSSYSLPPIQRLRRLVTVLQTAPKPLVFH